MRRMLTSLILAAALLLPSVAGAAPLADISGHWAENEINAAVDLGYVSGYPDGTFKPQGTLTRAEFVKMLVAAHKIREMPGGGVGYSDVGGHWVHVQGWLPAAENAGIVRPDESSDGLFHPDRAITRQDIAVMVVRAMGKESEARVNDGSSLGFQDTGKIGVHKGYIAIAVEAGIITGYEDNTFRPNDTATRAEAVVMVQRMLKATGQLPRSNLDDDVELAVHFLDVGQGDAILLQGPDFTILVDVGRHDRDDVVPHMRSLGVKFIDLLVGTHEHADHIGQLDRVLKAFPVKEVWLNGAEHTSSTFERAIDAILASNAAYHEPRAGERRAFGALNLEVLHPNHLTGDANNDSIVLKATYGQVSFLLTGDAEVEAEQQMLSSGRSLKADVLKLGHHGSRTSSTEPFLAAVSPEIAVYSAGAGNTYGHPHAEVLDRLRARGIAVYGTDTHGTITIRTNGTSYTITTSKAGPAPTSPPHGPSFTTCIDINSAPAGQLEQIIHIGPERAAEIMSLRPFKSLDDLIRVSGIGPARLQDIKNEGLACVR